MAKTTRGQRRTRVVATMTVDHPKYEAKSFRPNKKDRDVYGASCPAEPPLEHDPFNVHCAHLLTELASCADLLAELLSCANLLVELAACADQLAEFARCADLLAELASCGDLLNPPPPSVFFLMFYVLMVESNYATYGWLGCCVLFCFVCGWQKGTQWVFGDPRRDFELKCYWPNSF